MLGPVAGGVDDAQRDGADLDLVAVVHRVVRIVDARFGVDADRDAVLEREPAVPGDVVGVRVRLDRADDPHAAPLGLVQDRLDRERRVDDHRDPGLFVSHEITRTAQIVVQELVEDHDPTVAPGPAISLEAIRAGTRQDSTGRTRIDSRVSPDEATDRGTLPDAVACPELARPVRDPGHDRCSLIAHPQTRLAPRLDVVNIENTCPS